MQQHNIRLIARLDIKGDKLIKSVQLEGVQVVGDPNEYAVRYYEQGADEILLIDAVASLYARNHLADVIGYVASNAFVPITVGGGIRTLEDVDSVLRAGGDKVAINTAAVARPSLITEVANRFGSQCMVIQIDAKRRKAGGWEPYVDGAREPTGLDAVGWARRACDLGAGEVLLTSVDFEGTGKGLDIDLCRRICEAVPVPVIACGGVGRMEDIVEAVRDTRVNAIAMAHLLHIQRRDIGEIKSECRAMGLRVRLQ